MTVNEAAAALDVSPAFIYKLCREGLLAHTRIGLGRGTIRVSVKDIEVTRVVRERAAKGLLVQDEWLVKSVLVGLSKGDHERLQHLAHNLGLSITSYARMAVLERMKADEATG